MTVKAQAELRWITERDDRRLRRLSELLLSIIHDVDSRATPGEREEMPDPKAIQ